jgi:hypothetical protein
MTEDKSNFHGTYRKQLAGLSSDQQKTIPAGTNFHPTGSPLGVRCEFDQTM